LILFNVALYFISVPAVSKSIEAGVRIERHQGLISKAPQSKELGNITPKQPLIYGKSGVARTTA
jgi:hypothetical protein